MQVRALLYVSYSFLCPLTYICNVDLQYTMKIAQPHRFATGVPKSKQRAVMDGSTERSRQEHVACGARDKSDVERMYSKEKTMQVRCKVEQ